MSQILVPATAVVVALAAGVLLILLNGHSPVAGYGALLKGAFSGQEALARTLEKATPLILSGLAVAFAFRAGLFNIGGQGQLALGAITAAGVGYAVSLPAVLHLPLALGVGAFVGAAYASIVGVLKVTRGAHEVITTIMLNFIASNFTDWLAGGPWQDKGVVPRTPAVLSSARIPTLGKLPAGFVVAVVVAVAIWFVLRRTVLGFDLSTVGLNRSAGFYAGMPVRRLVIIAMAVSGALAGLGGAVESLGVVGRFEPGFNSNLGFDGITIAMLARTNPLGTIPAALLIGAMRAGSAKMQFDSGVPPELIDVIQALILFFVAAPMAIRWVLRMRSERAENAVRLAGWSS